MKVVRHFDSELVPAGGNPENTLVPLAVYDLAGHNVTVGEGILAAKNGQPLPATNAHLVIGLDLDSYSDMQEPVATDTDLREDLIEAAKKLNATYPEIQFIPKNLSIDDTPLLVPTHSATYASDISRGDFETMFDNLSAVKVLEGYTGVKSLLDEMKVVGLWTNPADGAYDYHKYIGFDWDKSAKKWVPDKVGSDYYQTEDWGGTKLEICQMKTSSTRFLVSAKNSSEKVIDQPSKKHIYDYKGTIVDVSATSKAALVNDNAMLYRLSHKYQWDYGWHMLVDYYPAAVAKAS